MKKSPTIHELAAHLNVSATTVWRVLNNRGRVSAETRERVRARVRDLNYEPSLVAQNLSHGRTRTLGVVVPNVSGAVFAQLIDIIEEKVFQHGYNVILGRASFDLRREAEYARMFYRRRVEGVIAIPFTRSASDSCGHLIELQERKIPVVLLEHGLPSERFPTVVADNHGAACRMTRHLIGLGHRRVAFAFHPGFERDLVGRERLAGFKQAMDEAGLADQACLLLDACDFQPDGTWTYSPENVIACFSRPDRPTAVFAGWDSLAVGVMETLQKIGLNVPQDVAVTGFDNIEVASYAYPPLTTVQQPTAGMASRAVEILFGLIDGRIDPAQPAAPERLPCELVIRQSCGARTARPGSAPEAGAIQPS